jgi:amino acid adenylation domain-containing protein
VAEGLAVHPPGGARVNDPLRGLVTEPSLVQVLRERSLEHPERPAYTFLADGEEEGARLTFAELDARARAAGALLQRLGLAGERALLLYPPGLEFISAFLGCLYGGVVAVPAYPPRSARMLPRLRAIARDARPAVALTSSELYRQVEGWAGRLPELADVRWVVTDGLEVEALAADWRESDIGGDTLAFLQYTSGSTALPKGVMVSHGNLLHNEEMIQAAFGQSERSVIVGWLPLYHDMGLIGNVLQPLYLGASCVLLSPVAFLQRPRRWLQAVTRYRATTSGGPNFAYELCVQRIPPAERHGLDLSSWEVAFNGAEPVRAETLERFAEAFAPCGFRREAFYPCYGLAEATLFVSGGATGAPPVVGAFRAADLELDRVSAMAALDPAGRRLVGCGRVWSGQEIAIVNPETGRRCPAERVGEIWVAGPSVAQGYWGKPEETVGTFEVRLEGESSGPYLRTGDLGFLREGELFITGRLKDLIILRGRNHYPQDLELTAEESHPALRPGCGAAFSVEVAGEERLVVVHELERRREGEAEAAAEAVRRAVAEVHEVQVQEVVLVRAGTIPKTSSGKIQRHACRAGYLAGALVVVGRSGLGRDEGEEEEPRDGADLDRGVLLALPPEERRPVLESWLRSEAARALGVAASRLETDRPLTASGLDSLAAIELRARVEAVLGTAVSLGDLLEGATLGDLADEALEGLRRPVLAPLPAAPAAGGEEVGDFPLSYGQRGLWYLHRLAPESLAYHLAGAGRVCGPLDAAALARACEALVDRHPALRTTFHQAPSGEPFQRVHAALAPELVVLDLEAGEDLEERLHAEVWRRFDLERGPLLRLGLLRPVAADPVLFLAIHHIVCDFGSLAVIARDLGVFYSLETGRPTPAPAPLDLRYTDYARWQEEWLAGPQGERLWTYWREVLTAGGSEPPWLDLVSDRPRPAVQTWSGDTRSFILDAALAAELQAFAHRHGATPYMVLLAGFEAVLARYTGQRDLLIGSPTTGRSSGPVSDLVGYFVNPVALRVLLPADPFFLSLLDEVRRVVAGAFEHRDLPLAALADRLQPQRDRSRPPLFDVLFTLQKAQGVGAGLGGFALGGAGAYLALGGIEIESLALQPAGAPFSLDFMLAEVEDGLGALLRFNSDLFDGATMERLAGHYRTLLAAALANPSTPLSELPLLTSAESRQLMVDWIHKGQHWPEDVLLHELFEDQARRTPDATALIAGSERLSYRELDERADRMARRLRALGVGPETRVGIFLQRRARLPISLLGVLKAGGAYVPLDPAYPRERLEAILADAEAPVLVTEGALLGALPADLAAQIVRADEQAPADLPALEPLPVRMGRLAYVIYTSGSTGRPKGIAIEHRSVSALMHWSREAFRPEELAGVLASTSICFDMSVFELFAPLAWGGTVILADNVLALADLPAREEVTLVDTVPSAMAELLRQGAVPASVKTVNLGGEPLRGALARQVHALGTVERLLNLYGPSEDTTFSTVAAVGPEGEPTIGQILANSWGYVLDRHLRLVPVGVPGELYLAGAGLSRGYLGRPDLTAERYVPDLFSTVPGARLYQTGDLVRWLPDGWLDFLGRLDHQVKVRGFRVELGEIEAALLAHPALQDAVVLALGEEGERRLVAYVVAREGEEAPEIADLRAHLRKKLPEYMMPSAAVVLESLPLTPNGKIDRRALAHIKPRETVEEEGYVAPRTPVEELLAGIWSELLGVERVGAGDDFFALGGHSLLAVRAASRVSAALGLDVAVPLLFEAPTPAALAAALAEPAGSGPAMPPLREASPAERERGLPLSYAQERLWFLDRLEPGSVTYNITGGVRLQGALDIPALARALAEVARRHEALRTRFEAREESPVQWVLAPRAADLPTIEVREEEVAQRILEEARRPFDLSRGPLLRASVLRLGEEDHVLLAAMHHIAADGWSMGVLFEELSVLYGAFAAGRPSPLAQPALQYGDYAMWERRWLCGEVLEERLTAARRRLASAPTFLELPADRPRPAVLSSRGSREPLTFSKQAVAALARREGATRFMVLLAALQALLGRYSGQEDLLVGSPVANRGRIETEGLIGCFVNTLVLRGDLGGDPGFAELLARARAETLAGFGQQDLPFEKLVEAVVPDRSQSRTPLVQVVLSVQTAPLAPSLPGLSARRLEVHNGTAKFELTLEVTEGEEGFTGWIEYHADLFEAATARRLASHYRALLVGAVADPERRLSALPLLGEAEQAQVLTAWNDTASDYPREAALAELFRAQVERSPGAVALDFFGERLTYAELDARANRLARHLRSLGVGRESLVGVFLDRSVELIVALLATIKAGGAYVPLDLSYPAERLGWMLEDSGAAVVVTREALAAALPETGIPTVLLDREAERIAARSAEAPELAASADDLAYVMYTSGSTGRPKGVAIPQRGILRLLLGTDYVTLGPEERIAQVANVSFDVATFEIWGALLHGGCLVGIERELLVAPRQLAAALVERRITVVFLTTAVFNQVAREAPQALRGVRHLFAGGEALDATWVREAIEKGSPGRMINGYGPTESTTYAVCYRVEEMAAGAPSVPIGRPIANTTGYVVDRDLGAVPVGVAGELLLGGDGLARGYWRRPGLTAERFVPNPFGEAGSRLYRTGDLARWLADGRLDFLGRIDQQVKVRGFRIELGEIEAVLGEHPGVGHAVVAVRADAGGPRLIAWVVPREPGALAAFPGELREHLRAKLPEHMVPTAWVRLESLPLTPNGKVDRRALPAPEAESATGWVAPRMPAEELLAGIWCEVLGRDRVGATDDFFELGGHSLLAVRAASRVSAALGLEVPVSLLFEAPTPAALAAALREPAEPGLVMPPLCPASVEERERGLPLSYAQERLWFLDRLEPGSATYNITGGVRLQGALDTPALARALAEMARRHEALRTRFEIGAEAPVQRVLPPPAPHLPVVDLSGSENAPAETLRRILAEARRPFDLAGGPLLRTTLLRLGAEDHAICVSMHHIASDGWSMEIFLRELADLYGAFVAGQPSPLAAPAIQYGDYALWERRWLWGEILEARLAEARRRLAGAPTFLELPADRPRPAVLSSRGAREPLELPRDGIAALARREGATPFMVLFAALQALLGRYTGQEDLLVGSPVANRGRVETEELVGFFVNTVVLRGNLAGDPSFGEVLARARAETLAAFNQQDLPFEKLVEALVSNRSRSQTPLVQVVLVLQPAPLAPSLPGLAASRLDVHNGTAKFELTLELTGSEEGLAGWIEYSADLFEGVTAERLAGHYRRLLAGALADPSRRLSDLPLLGESEKDQVLRAWNDTASDYPREATLSELFQAQVERSPRRAALEFFGERLTYAELDARANRLARHLRSLGVGRESLVGVFLDRSVELIVTLLAAIKAGGAYVPLDLSYPPERLGWMLEDSGAAVVVSREALAAALPETGVPTVLLDREEEGLAAQSSEAPEVETSADDLAYVMYTSGSTGRPKGVAIPQRGIVRLVIGTDYATLGPEDRIAQVANVSFDVATFEIWGALLHGGCLVGIERDLLVAPRELAEEIVRRRITVVFLTAALFNQVAREAPQAFRGARYLFAGGEALDPTWVREAIEKGSPGRMINGYGPTESTTYAVCGHVERVEEGAVSVPIGRSIANTTGYVVDRNLRPAPIGVAGELLLGGDGLARGYWRRPGLTAGRFVPNPFGKAGSRLYRTGDLARWLADGRLDFLGRIDHQVKVRGFRVELGEIEVVLTAHPAVAAAVVQVWEPVAGERRLAAWVVGKDGSAPEARELRAHLRAKLPEHMVPATWVLLEALPLTPNGKVDRTALPAPEGEPGGGVYVAPATPAEQVLAGIWAALLGLERVGAGEHFFELGGHSLLATQVQSRVREALGVDLPLGKIFEAPTVRGLAREIEALRAAESGSGALPLHPLPRGFDVPLAFAQERLWFLDQLEPGSPAYNIAGGVRLRGNLDIAVLTRSLGEIVRRHEPLRTTFASRGGRPVQVIGMAAGSFLPLTDLSGLPQARREPEAWRLSAEEAVRPFDLARGPLFRASLLRLGEEEYVLLAAMHHIAADGWSMEIFLRELADLYGAFSAGLPSPLAEPAIQYGDYALWERTWLCGEILEARLAEARRRLAGAPTFLELAADLPRPAVLSSRGSRTPLALAGDGVASLARRQGATRFMVLLAALQALLGRYSGQQELLVGTPVANRGRVETEGLIGCFVNTVVLRADLAGDPGFADLLVRTRAEALAAFNHQDLPFEKLVEALVPERSLSRTPLVQVVLSVQNAPLTASLPGLSASRLDVHNGTAKFELTLEITEGEEGFSGWIEYHGDLFEAATVRRLASHYRALLVGAVADPERRLSALPLLGEAEQAQVLTAWNDTASDYPREATLAGLFQAQVERSPGAVALDFFGERLTYAELDARANRLARHLRSLGVGRESLVGVFLDRSVELIVTLLAAIKAGGAYVPLDLSYPPERLGWMLEDSGAAVVVTCEALAAALPERGARKVLLDVEAERIAAQSAETPEVETSADDLAYVMYTSGSTGRPKGVAIPQRGILRLLLGTDYVTLGPEERIAQVANVSFDVATFEIWGALLHGGCLVGIERELLVAPRELAAALVERRITVVFLTTALFNQVAREAPQALRGVRHLFAGGEALDATWVREAIEKGSPGRMINGYGPTESTTYAVCYRVEEMAAGAPSVPIGRPIANTTGYVVDRDLGAVPVGVAGELLLGGDGLARGYWRRPGLTAERFVPNPFGEAGSRLYRTGDLARWLADGRLDFLGRIDQQVKVRGFRIELGEIEAVLGEHPGVGHAVVAVRVEAGGPRLIAWIVPREPGVLVDFPRELREHLRAKLPEHMVPTAWVRLESLPLTPNGKVDRRALPAPEGEPGGGIYVAPATPAEQILAGIWAALLGLERVGADEHFFELGGHSLLATQVQSRVCEAFGIDLPLRKFFAAPTIAELAREIEASRIEESGSVAPPLRPVPRDGDLPLAFAQERLWFLDQLEPGSSAYNIAGGVRLRGTLEIPVLRRALGEIVSRHEPLRTTFASRGGRPVQVIAIAAGTPLPLTDLSGLPEAWRELEARRLSGEEAAHRFDLARGPLFRTSLLRLGSREHVLLLTVHHIVSDGWSMTVLIREIAALYTAFNAGGPTPLPQLPVQYVDFAVWQREWLRGEALESQVAYWRERLAGVQALDLPTDRPRPRVQTSRGDGLRAALPAVLSQTLSALASRRGSSLYMVLLAAFKLLMSRLSGQEDVSIGTPIAGRTRPEIEGLIGLFLNSLTLRTDLAGDPTFGELVERVRETALEAYAHQDVPFEKLLEELRPERDLSRTPLFQVFFNMLNLPRVEASLPRLTQEPFDFFAVEAKFDLTLYVSETERGIELHLVYNTDLFERARMEELLRQYQTVLARAVARPDDRIGSYSLLTAEAPALLPDPRAPLGEEWIGAVHELFRQRAARHPGRPAVLGPGVTWSYGELDEASDRLAACLQAAGVRPGDRVAIYAHRSPPLVPAVLGALKAGGAFVMLDPACPVPRLLDLLRLAEPRAWVRLAAAGEPPAEVADWGAELPQVVLPAGGPGAALAALPPGGPVRVEMGPDDLACVAFTSGSTGLPKGILGRHGPLSHFLPWQCARFGLAESDRFSMLSGLSHDPLQRDLFTPLFLGAAICVPDPDEIAPRRLAVWMARQGVSVAHLTPAMGQLLTEGAGDDLTVPSLRSVLLVGDVLTRLDVARLRRLAPAVRCVNLYGSTETQRAVGYHAVGEAEIGDGAPGRQVLPLGRGMPDVQLLVLTREQRLAGIGELGEIAVRSPHLAAGYLGDADLTRERFLANPFGEVGTNDRIYRTGDLGRFRPDGEVEFVARADKQVKIRGFRVELGEIEAALARHPAVREAVVIAGTDRSGEKRLVGYVVPHGEGARPLPPANELQDFLRQRLPEYMVPPAWVELARLPLTPNGKVDRRALPEPESPRPDLAASYVAPRTETEQAIAEIWQEVLQLEKVGIHDKFFHLGGHSLLLVRVHARLRERFGQELSLLDLFRYPDISSLTELLERSVPARLTPVEDRAGELAQGKERRRQQLEKSRRRAGGVR